MENWPKLIVFDFHGTLSLPSKVKTTGYKESKLLSLVYGKESTASIGDVFENINSLKNYLRKFKSPEYKITNWYQCMTTANIDPLKMVPTLDQLVEFVKYVKAKSPMTYFGIASSNEMMNFMTDMMRYCFESRNMLNPFEDITVVGNEWFPKYTHIDGNLEKVKHILIIETNLIKNDRPGAKFIEWGDVVLIDNESKNLDDVMNIKDKFPEAKGWICGILTEDYFTINDWNNNNCGFTKIPI